MFAAYFILFPKLRREARYFLPNIFPLGLFRDILSPDFYRALADSSDIYQEPERLKETCEDEYWQLTLTYLRSYLPSLFVVEDKISMAFSLESRTPLCDNELLDIALSLPLSEKLRGYELKHIPRRAMTEKLPAFIFSLPKRGFPTPLRHWFKRELRDYVRDTILDCGALPGIFNRTSVEKLICGYQDSMLTTPYDEIYAHRIWLVLNLLFYLKNQRTRYRAMKG